MPNDPKTRLGEIVAARRANLSFSKEAAAKLAPMASDTWSRVEDGLGVRDTTYSAIERVLKWEAGSIWAVLGGGDPTPLAEVQGSNPVGFGLDEEARGLSQEKIEAVRAIIRGMKP